jgi:hypothetical protein
MLKMNKISKYLFLSLFLILIFSCTPTLEKFDSLANQGLLPLSNDNPHLGANLFLAQEAQKSTYLMNFLKKRGGPTAIEVLTESRPMPTLILFYPLKKEVYVSDLHQNEISYQWVVRGPYMMERRDFQDLNGMGVSFAAEPVFLISGQQTRFGQKPIEPDHRALLPVIPTPRPTAIKKRPAKSDVIVAASTPTPFRPLNSDQQAIAASQGFAERAENGDLIHVVNGENESLEEIAKWYTGSGGNQASIAQLNGITSGSPLTKGMRIRVPYTSVKQFKAYSK